MPGWRGSNNIITSPVHHKYISHMRGVDVANQLQASYSCQSRSHKWWHRIFDFLLDQIEVNMYVLYLDQVRCQRMRVPPMNHLEFKMKFCESLVAKYR